jgi:hypothetical protein
MANVFYNRIIRKLVVAFGNLFSNITLVRYNPDNTEAERFIVPISYAAKELYVQRLQSDYNLNKKVQMALPRMSYELIDLSYDNTRKQTTNIKNFNLDSAGNAISQYNPVPYNFNFNLYVYVRNIGDITQIVEHILPFFTPDYTIKLNLVPEMGIVKEVPIILNSASYETVYEGPRDSDPRIIVWTLSATVKGFIFGSISPVNLIKASITNIFNKLDNSSPMVFNLTPENGVGTYQLGELVYQGYSPKMSTATAKVLNYNAKLNKLTLGDINGDFVSNKIIVGSVTNSQYTFQSYEQVPVELAQIITIPTPTDAFANTLIGFSTTINEVPNIITNVASYINFTGDISGDLLFEIGLDDLNIQIEKITDLNSG